MDVRLDDVVLRALEKDPELRYQHVSQVKTAVDTIVGSAAPPPQPPTANAAAMAQEILDRDYALNIRSCVRRAWRLLKSEFWAFVGITALVLALLSFAGSFGAVTISQSVHERTDTVSSAVLMLVWGPLFGGLFLYFLKKMRKETATVETAFSGFSPRFLQLFLAGFVTTLLTWLGFLLILPGIYLSIAWMFTLPLVVDKQLDFWSAMELSRKVVTKHWFKFLGLGLILFLLAIAGVLALVIGMFITTPLILVSLMYAYEDVFGRAGSAAPTPAPVGPSGTIVMPPPPPVTPRAGFGSWNLATKIGLGAVVVFFGIFLLAAWVHHHRLTPPWFRSVAMAQPVRVMNETPVEVTPVEAVPPVPPIPPEIVPVSVFGPAIEREMTNLLAINLDSGKEAPLPQSVTALNRGPEKDSAACAWMEGADVDLAYVSAYDGFYGMTRDMVTLKPDDWDNATPDSLGASLHDTGQDVPAKFGNVTRLDNPTNYTYGFKTRTGRVGLLQISGFTASPSTARIRYKLIEKDGGGHGATLAGGQQTREQLAERLEAASNITDSESKQKPITAITVDAARAGEVEIVKQALGQLSEPTSRDAAAHEAALLLAKRGLRKQAIELARGYISDETVRNQALSTLAQ